MLKSIFTGQEDFSCGLVFGMGMVRDFSRSSKVGVEAGFIGRSLLGVSSGS